MLNGAHFAILHVYKCHLQVGSFFDFAPLEGSYTLNPPFVPELLKAISSHCTQLLDAAVRNSKALSFAIIVGANEAARNDPSWELLSNGIYHVCPGTPMLVSIGDHGYFSGEQHLKKERRLLSTCDTAVFFWQSARAQDRWPVNAAA
eukprot:SAG31_NODE_1163_length_9588_cov_8.265676_4_plen_147_part_00